MGGAWGKQWRVGGAWGKQWRVGGAWGKQWTGVHGVNNGGCVHGVNYSGGGCMG